MNMKFKPTGFSQRYVAALEKQIKRGPGASLEPAVELGREAVALKLDTLELAWIHEQAIATLGLSEVNNAFTKLAGIFFTEANMLIEETHRTAREARNHLDRVMVSLGKRTEELAASNRQLQKGVAKRKFMEDDFAERGRHHEKCLEESLELQKRLRLLTHKVLAAQENERKQISRELQNEIAQTLLGINVRLLSLKQEARRNTTGLKKEITSTQKLVTNSARSVRRVGREIGGRAMQK
jgi:signal transduction histidine kinase